MPRSDMYAIPGKDAGLDYDAPYYCPEDHEGDSYQQPDLTGGTMVERWTCCDEETTLGEIVDCDTCLEPGISNGGLPPGWIEDTNGAHCPRCQPPA